MNLNVKKISVKNLLLARQGEQAELFLNGVFSHSTIHPKGH